MRLQRPTAPTKKSPRVRHNRLRASALAKVWRSWCTVKEKPELLADCAPVLALHAPAIPVANPNRTERGRARSRLLQYLGQAAPLELLFEQRRKAGQWADGDFSRCIARSAGFRLEPASEPSPVRPIE